MMECKRVRTSKVWESFTKLQTKNAVVCNTCKAELAFHGSTTCMLEHLKRKRPGAGARAGEMDELYLSHTQLYRVYKRSEMCSLHLTHPSVHTWSSGQPTVQRPGSSHGLPFGAGIRTHNLGLPRVSSPTLYPLGQRLPKIIELE